MLQRHYCFCTHRRIDKVTLNDRAQIVIEVHAYIFNPRQNFCMRPNTNV